jgi:hypothetical protein
MARYSRTTPRRLAPSTVSVPQKYQFPPPPSTQPAGREVQRKGASFFSLARDWRQVAPWREELRLLHLYLVQEGGLDQSEDGSGVAVQGLQFFRYGFLFLRSVPMLDCLEHNSSCNMQMNHYEN